MTNVLHNPKYFQWTFPKLSRTHGDTEQFETQHALHKTSLSLLVMYSTETNAIFFIRSICSAIVAWCLKPHGILVLNSWNSSSLKTSTYISIIQPKTLVSDIYSECNRFRWPRSPCLEQRLV